jgi:hypothetical protein
MIIFTLNRHHFKTKQIINYFSFVFIYYIRIKALYSKQYIYLTYIDWLLLQFCKHFYNGSFILEISHFYRKIIEHTIAFAFASFAISMACLA